MTYKLVLFDWSGTLSDDRKPVYLANKKLLESYGRPEISYDDWLTSRCGSAVEFARNHGVVGSHEEIQGKFSSFFREYVDSGVSRPTPYPNIDAILASIKRARKKLVVISSHPETFLRREADEYGVARHFEEIIGSIFDKSATIRNAALKYEIPLEDVIYIGDTIQDMRAAKRAGVDSIGVWTGYHSKEQLEAEKPTHLVEHVGFVPGLLGVRYDTDEATEMQAPKSLTKIKRSDPFCFKCGTLKTPQWRRGPYHTAAGEMRQTLCNACGIKWRRDCQNGKEPLVAFTTPTSE